MAQECRSTVIRVLALALLLGRASGAQTPAGGAAEPRFETRARLEAAVRVAEGEHRSAEARLLNARLQHGDFEEGDKILLSIEVTGLQAAEAPGTVTIGGADTAVVRADKMLPFTRLPGVPPMSLEGVLRSELVDTVTAHVSKYVRNPRVHATPLLRVAITGAVGRPGWYSAPGDAVLADVIMQAGGVSAESDIDNTVIRRAGQQIWKASDIRSALANGLSLDRLQLRAGDEILVGSRRQWWGLATTIQVATSVVALYLASRSFHR